MLKPQVCGKLVEPMIYIYICIYIYVVIIVFKLARGAGDEVVLDNILLSRYDKHPYDMYVDVFK